MYRGLAPHKIMPMPGTHKSMHADCKNRRGFRYATATPLFATGDARRYLLLRRHVAEKKIVTERAETECCEASFCWKKYKLEVENISLRKSGV